MVPVPVDLSNTWEQLPNTNTVSPNKYKIHKQNTNAASPNTKYTLLYTNAVSPSIKYTISYTNTVSPNTKYTILYTNAVSPNTKYTILYTNDVSPNIKYTIQTKYCQFKYKIHNTQMHCLFNHWVANQTLVNSLGPIFALLVGSKLLESFQVS